MPRYIRIFSFSLFLLAFSACDEPERRDAARLELVNGRHRLRNWIFQAPVNASEIQTFFPAASNLGANDVVLTEPIDDEPALRGLATQILGTGADRRLFFHVPDVVSPMEKRRFTLRPPAARGTAAGVSESQPAILPAKRPPPLEVIEELNRVIIRNPWYEVVHDRALGAGIIRVENRTGGSVVHLRQADELKLAPPSGRETERTYKMARDAQPKVTIDKGPLCARVEARVRFIGDDGDRKRCPEAIYQYDYFSTLPLIKLRVIFPEQAVTEPFPVVNLFKFLFKGRPFSQFVMGDPPRSGEMTQGGISLSTTTGSSMEWGFLKDEFFAFGITGPQLGGVYTGPTYQYLNSTGRSSKRGEPWVGRYYEWSGYLYAGPANQAISHLRAVNDYHLALNVRDFSTMFDAVETKIEQVANPAAKTLVGMLLAAARDRVEKGRDLAHAEQLVRYAVRLVDAGAPSDDPLAINHGSFVAMANDQLGILFKKSAQTLTLDSVYQSKRRHAFLAPADQRRPIWNLKLIDITNQHFLSFASYEAKMAAPSLKRVSPTKTRLSLAWTISLKNRVGSVPVRATVSLERGAPTSAWRIYVAPEFSRFSLWNVDFPFIGGVAPRFGEGVDYLATPNGIGTRLENPSEGSEYAQYYPGQANMQFIAYWQNQPDPANGGAGLYLAALDRNANIKRFVVHPRDGRRFDAYVQHPAVNMGIPGNAFEMNYDCEIGVFDGDWHDAAVRYRQWALKRKWTPKALRANANIPKWVHDNRLSLRTTLPPSQAAQTVEILRQSLDAPTLIDWENWTTAGHAHAAMPDATPADNLDAVIEDSLDVGVSDVLTLSPLIWNVESESWRQEGGMNACCRDFAQNLKHLKIDDQRLAIMCVNKPLWRKILLQSAAAAFDVPGVDGLFAHLAGTDTGQLCQATDHGHPVGGGHHQIDALRSLLRTIRRAARERNPSFALLLDGSSECYLDVCDSFLTELHNQADLNVVAIPLFQAVYGDRVVPFGVRDATLADHPLANLALAQMFAYGVQLGRFHPERLIKERARFGILKMLSDYQNVLSPWLVHGEMLKPPRVDYVNPPSSLLFTKKLAVVTSAWKADDGSLLILLVNAGVKTPVTVALTVDPADYGLSNPEGSPVRWIRATPEFETPVETEDGVARVTEILGDFGVLALKAVP